jgi:hypothetical protein
MRTKKMKIKKVVKLIYVSFLLLLMSCSHNRLEKDFQNPPEEFKTYALLAYKRGTHQ